MQKFSVVSSRYAQAVYHLAQSENQVEAVLEDFAKIATACKESEELRVFLKSPVINPALKKQAFSKAFEGKISSITLAFVEKLISIRREAILLDITHAYKAYYNEQNGIVSVEVTSAVKLDTATLEKVKSIVKQNAAYASVKQFNIIEKVNPAIIGGLIIKVDDKQIDESILTQINNMKNNFSKNPYIKAF